jgi:hypothetical protein
MAATAHRGRYRSFPGRGGVLADPKPAPGVIPAFLDDASLGVTLAEVNASVAFERATKQHDIDTRAAKAAPRPARSRP